MDLLRNGIMVLKVCKAEMALANEILRKECFLSFAKKQSCVRHIHGFQRAEENNRVHQSPVWSTGDRT